MALAFRRVSKVYQGAGRAPRFALRDVSFDLAAGRRVAIVGRSGSGKSTLLHVAAGIDVPTAGDVVVGGRSLGALSDRARTLLRRAEIGLVFQFFHLLPHLSVHDNVALPELIAGGRPATFRPRVGELLERVGLADRAADPVHELSGGEMQRVAICRALLRRPRLLLADEPTGNLDEASSRLVLDLMLSLAKEEESALLYVTHSRELAGLADETWRLQDGGLGDASPPGGLRP
ncbi:MAG TPA: ABC transporter ATP-binding protein [Methylomirabilota bacterium]|nr:ABC transporter ATP-binding protein [Methylomirabilota bacterium]